jgi:hypothetical protein
VKIKRRFFTADRKRVPLGQRAVRALTGKRMDEVLVASKRHHTSSVSYQK